MPMVWFGFGSGSVDAPEWPLGLFGVWRLEFEELGGSVHPVSFGDMLPWSDTIFKSSQRFLGVL